MCPQEWQGTGSSRSRGMDEVTLGAPQALWASGGEKVTRSGRRQSRPAEVRRAPASTPHLCVTLTKLLTAGPPRPALTSSQLGPHQAASRPPEQGALGNQRWGPDLQGSKSSENRQKLGHMFTHMCVHMRVHTQSTKHHQQKHRQGLASGEAGEDPGPGQAKKSASKSRDQNKKRMEGPERG